MRSEKSGQIGRQSPSLGEKRDRNGRFSDVPYQIQPLNFQFRLARTMARSSRRRRSSPKPNPVGPAMMEQNFQQVVRTALVGVAALATTIPAAASQWLS